MISMIAFRNLHHVISEGSCTKTILAQVSGSWQRERTVALRGASGSGKTTLLSIIAGLREPSGGEVLYDGFPIAIRTLTNRACVTNGVGYVFQDSLLIPTFSVIENIALKGLVRGMSPVHVHEEGVALLQRLRLAHKLHELPTHLSGGEQQRVAVARALYGGASFLLLDEPTAHLDKNAREELLEFLHTIHRDQQCGLVIATHDAQVAAALDEVWELKQGMLERVR